MRCFVLLVTSLLTISHGIVADDNLYEAFLPSSELDGSEWTSNDLGTATNGDLMDISSFEDPMASLDQGLPMEFAGTGSDCSLGTLRPRGVDDYCGSNLAPPEKQLIIPNLSTLQLDLLCPKKFPSLTSNTLVCASKDPDNIQSSLFMAKSLFEAQLGGSLCYVPEKHCITSNMDGDDEDEF